MKILLVTEKCSPTKNQHDGGAILVETLKKAFGDSMSVMQFGSNIDSFSTWNFNYPFNQNNRFERRISNANFIATQVKAVEKEFTHVIFIHISMQFGLIDIPLREDIEIWTFPMFLSASYTIAGEQIPDDYLKIERLTLSKAKNILTPSHLEKQQLIDLYSIPEEHIYVVPRGINTDLFMPEVPRYLSGTPEFCSIGSIKPQKNIIGLIRLFAKIVLKFPGATLLIIGPIQDYEYYIKVSNEIRLLGLSELVKLVGHINQNELSTITKNSHIHLSMSLCETFGRSIFETLALGIPNIAKLTGNAAAEFLNNLPYARFIDDDNEMLNAIEETLANLSMLSSMAFEIATLYDDRKLSQLLVATICKKECIAISDFDGTLFHKDDLEKTQRCIEAFRNYSVKVICSARPIESLIPMLKLYNLEVDWIIGCSGAIVTNGQGILLWFVPLEFEKIIHLENLLDTTTRVEAEGNILQIASPIKLLPAILGLRMEIYQNMAFIASWKASKLHAIHRLLDHINWSGQVHAFGDGLYDIEFLTYFDGITITPTPCNNRQKKEIENVQLTL